MSIKLVLETLFESTHILLSQVLPLATPYPVVIGSKFDTKFITGFVSFQVEIRRAI